MPAYVSHVVMANDVYDKINNKNINIDYMLTFSLGGDLARFSKCRRICHKEKMEEFIDNIWNYIKDNNLVNNGEYLGFLYGHICHYYMDSVCHPLIRKIDKISVGVKTKSHTLIESYIDAYLVKNKYDLDIENLDTRYMFRGNVIRLYRMINCVYEKTYGVKNVSFSYFITKIIYSKIRWLFIIFGKNLLKKISYFNKYMSINREVDILNSRNKIEYNNYLGNKCDDGFMDLYDKSINLAINRINGLK